MRNTVDFVTYAMLVRIFRINLEHIIISAQNGMIVGCSRHLQVVGLVDSTAYCSLIHINHLPEIEMKIPEILKNIWAWHLVPHTHTHIYARARQQKHIYTLIAHTRNTMCGLWLQLFNEKIYVCWAKLNNAFAYLRVTRLSWPCIMQRKLVSYAVDEQKPKSFFIFIVSNVSLKMWAQLSLFQFWLPTVCHANWLE